MYHFFNFSAFDTQIEFGLEAKTLVEAKRILEYLKKSAKEFEQNYSRFLDKSQLNKFNKLSKNPRTVSAELKKMIALSKTWHKKTRGIFDPTIINSLMTVGYDRTFPLTKKPSKNNIADKKLQIPGFKNIKIVENKIFTPQNWQIDLGGIGKGFWVDKMTGWIKKQTNNFFLSAGGDIYLSGRAENDAPWEVNIENPQQKDNDLLTITNKNSTWAVATSGINRRSGIIDGRPWHHLIDPRTGKPADNDILTVTVVSNNIISADVLAKTVLIMGKKAGLDYINSQTNNECVIVDENLKTLYSKNFKQYLKQH